MNHFKTVFSGALKNVSLMVLALVVIGSLNASANAQNEHSQEASLVQVETRYVCMINNQRFEKEQIAIEVEGRTYYGCCEMCKDKLKKDKASRWATDPVSGKKVDKAKAVIGVNTEGKAFYFETVENLKKFKADSGHSEHKQDGKKHGSHN
jgi:YHS domain-containing protein